MPKQADLKWIWMHSYKDDRDSHRITECIVSHIQIKILLLILFYKIKSKLPLIKQYIK